MSAPASLLIASAEARTPELSVLASVNTGELELGNYLSRCSATGSCLPTRCRLRGTVALCQLIYHSANFASFLAHALRTMMTILLIHFKQLHVYEPLYFAPRLMALLLAGPGGTVVLAED
jgi:hypothetical protein